MSEPNLTIHQIKRDDDAFQQPVDEQDLSAQLHRELPDEDLLEIVELSAGLFNNTFRVRTSKDTYILKIAPGKTAEVFFNERCLMQRERTVSRQLGSLSPLVPEYLSFFSVDGRDAFLQPFISGALWQDVMPLLSKAENAELWKQLGAFARTVHACRGEQFGYPAPLEGHGQWSGFIVSNIEGMVEDCRRLGIQSDEVEVFCRHLPRFLGVLDRVKIPRLLHGDLWPRNVIIDGAGADIHLKAVFDGERAFWGDPVSDWVLILYGVPEAFWQGYGENPVKSCDPVRIAIYKGMYFILNMLEAVRFHESDEEPRRHLSAVNCDLENS